MNIAAIRKLRKKLAQDEPTFGVWVTLESPTVTEIAVSLGVDWIVIDAEHGHLDWKEIAAHIRATVRSETVTLVRIAERSSVLTKRALDIGADGVMIPWVETEEVLREAVLDCLYPPQGRRGIGGERATVWGQCLVDHTTEANDHVLIVPIVETTATLANLPSLCKVDGVEFFFFGPADYSSTAGYRGQWEGPGVAEQIVRAKDIIRGAGKNCGILARNPEDLASRVSQGFRLLALGSDTGMIFKSLHEALRSADRDRTPAPSLDPKDGSPVL